MNITSSVDFQQAVTVVRWRPFSATTALATFSAAGVSNTPGTNVYWLTGAPMPAGTIQVEWSCADLELTCFDRDLIIVQDAPAIVPPAPVPTAPLTPAPIGSEFDDFIAAGFAEAMEVLNPVVSQGKRRVEITFAGKSKPCIATSFMRGVVLRENGYQGQIPSVVELTRADFLDLAIGDRSEVTVSGQPFSVMVIEDDPHDLSSVRLHLEFHS